MVIRAGCLKTSSSSSSSELMSSECSDSEDNESEQTYESISLCTSKKHLINPNDLIDDSFEFDQNFSQSIEVDLCTNEGATCSEHPILKTRCKQKYLSIQLQVVSKNNTRSELKTFSIPSNCQCVFYRNWWRIGHFKRRILWYIRSFKLANITPPIKPYIRDLEQKSAFCHH